MRATNARGIVEDVLSPGMARELWTGNYDKALPISVQEFDLSAILPAVFYMFRYGQRRGRGTFLNTFGPETGTPKERRQAATIEHIANTLIKNDTFTGFEGEVERAIMGDLLLCFCLENIRHALGRTEQVQRVAPAHYLASWVDLPDRVAHLRYVPEMIVAMLADQKGDYVQQNDGTRTWFPVGRGFEDNLLLRAFNQGVRQRGELGSRTADSFDEQTRVGLDQLLMVRLAQQLKAAPDKARGRQVDQISNQRPIAEKAAEHFSEDMRRFVRAYAGSIPRHAFVELLESCMAVGLTTIFTSTIEILLAWAETGEICMRGDQEPAYLFVDCSNGVDRQLRGLAEQSMDEFMRRVERFPTILMALRLLDHRARYNREIKGLETRPYATAWLNLLGDLLHGRHPHAQLIRYTMEEDAEKLAEELEDEYGEAAQMLHNVENQPNPLWRLAEALTSLLGPNTRRGDMMKMIDSMLLINRPHGLASKRKTRRSVAGIGTRQRDVRALVFTDAVLDYLVHLHVLQNGNRSGVRAFSFKAFMGTLHERYGFAVDVAPPGLDISNDLLQRNRAILERRLRDLGLLVGVNDAEAMKRLRPRFTLTTEDEHGMD